MDAADLCWSPNGSCIAVQDSVLTYRVFIMRADGENADVFRCVCALVYCRVLFYPVLLPEV
jgi:hypothetical protein